MSEMYFNPWMQGIAPTPNGPYIQVGYRAYPREYIHGKVRSVEEYPYSHDVFLLHGGRGEKPENLQSVYHDRMVQWDRDKFQSALRSAKIERENFNSMSMGKIETFLGAYFGHKVKLWRVLQWCNQSSGYPIWSFEYTMVENAKEE